MKLFFIGIISVLFLASFKDASIKKNTSTYKTKASDILIVTNLTSVTITSINGTLVTATGSYSISTSGPIGPGGNTVLIAGNTSGNLSLNFSLSQSITGTIQDRIDYVDNDPPIACTNFTNTKFPTIAFYFNRVNYLIIRNVTVQC